MTDQEKKYKREWTFSFGDLNDKITDFVKTLNTPAEETIVTEQFSEPLGTTSSASVRIDSPVGKTTVKSNTAGNLFDAEITHVGEVEFAVAGEAEKHVTLSQKLDPSQWMRGFFGWIGSSGQLIWDISVTSAIPLALDIHSGVGEAQLDLHDLNLTDVQVHGGAGSIKLMLPNTGVPYRAEINGGIGEIEVEVAAGATVDLRLRAGTGEIDLTIGEGADVNAAIQGGIGECKVRVPGSAEVRIQAKLGLGDIDTSPRFARLSGNRGGIGANGMWQTVGYETAERAIDIRYEGGVGAFKIR